MSYLRTISIVILAATIFMTTACGGESEPQDQVFKLDVRGGELALDSDALRVNQGDTVTLTISSDQHGRFHLHGYDLQKEITTGEVTTLTFVAFATGKFNIVFHTASEQSEGHGHDGHDDDEEKEEILIGSLEVQPR